MFVALTAQHAALTLTLACCLVSTSYLVETCTYQALTFLERQQVIERLAPQFAPTETKYQKQTAATFLFSSWIALAVALYPPVLNRLLSIALPNWNPLQLVATLVTGLVLHDAWFFLVHTTLHRCKSLYIKFHLTHHKSEGGLTVHGTADMEPTEAVMLFFGFYASMLVFYAYVVGTWNPVAYTAFVLLESSLNMTGHCGYHVPLWLSVLLTWGVCFIPGVAQAKTHYIHHLDPRFNRALYFTWWDRAAGTFKDEHPAIKVYSPDEQANYEQRVFLNMRKRLHSWLGLHKD